MQMFPIFLRKSKSDDDIGILAQSPTLFLFESNTKSTTERKIRRDSPDLFATRTGLKHEYSSAHILLQRAITAIFLLLQPTLAFPHLFDSLRPSSGGDSSRGKMRGWCCVCVQLSNFCIPLIISSPLASAPKIHSLGLLPMSNPQEINKHPPVFFLFPLASFFFY